MAASSVHHLSLPLLLPVTSLLLSLLLTGSYALREYQRRRSVVTAGGWGWVWVGGSNHLF